MYYQFLGEKAREKPREKILILGALFIELR